MEKGPDCYTNSPHQYNGENSGYNMYSDIKVYTLVNISGQYNFQASHFTYQNLSKLQKEKNNVSD